MYVMYIRALKSVGSMVNNVINSLSITMCEPISALVKIFSNLKLFI